VNPLSEYGAVW